MSIGDALKFDLFSGKALVKGIAKDPKRLVLGVDPASTKMWNGILGRKDKPLVNTFGGPTKSTFASADAHGLDTGTARTAHAVAKTVAGIWGGYGAMNGLGNAAQGLRGAQGAQGAQGGQGLMRMPMQMPQQQQPQQQQTNPWLEQLRQQEAQRQQQELMRQQIAAALAAQQQQGPVLS